MRLRSLRIVDIGKSGLNANLAAVILSAGIDDYLINGTIYAPENGIVGIATRFIDRNSWINENKSRENRKFFWWMELAIHIKNRYIYSFNDEFYAKNNIN